MSVMRSHHRLRSQKPPPTTLSEDTGVDAVVFPMDAKHLLKEALVKFHLGL